MTNIISYDKIALILKNIRSQYPKIILVGGCFDIFHYGHFHFLKEAKEQGDFLIVILESDKFIKTSKKREPLHNQKQRAEIIAGLRFVDLVVLLPYFNSNAQYFDLVKTIRPSIIAITQGDPKRKEKEKAAKVVSASVNSVTRLFTHFSSSKLRQQCDFF